MESEAIRLFDVIVGVMVPIVGVGGYYIVALLIRMALVEQKLGEDKLDRILEGQSYANQRLSHIENHLDIDPPQKVSH